MPHLFSGSWRKIRRSALALFLAPCAWASAVGPQAELSSAERARLDKATLMLGVSTELRDLAGAAPYVQAGMRSQVWIARPHDADWKEAKELSVAFAPGAAPAFVAFNRVVFALEDGALRQDAARLVASLSPVAEAPQPRPGRAVFITDVPTALEAFELADRLSQVRGVRFAHPDLLAAVTLDGALDGPGPEIRVLFDGLSVADGGAVDFGSANQAANVERVFTVVNDGGGTLSLGQPSVQGGFSVTDGFTSTTLLAGQSTSMRIRMSTQDPGPVAGSVSFLNNDADENPFEISMTGDVQAAAGPAEIAVSLDGVDLHDSQTVGFGSTPLGIGVERTFRVANVGGAPLSVGTVTVGPGFMVTQQPQSPVAGGDFTEFRVRMNAALPGTPTADLSFLNNDADENPFDLLVTGGVNDSDDGAQMAVVLDGQQLANGGVVSFGAAEWYQPVIKSIEVRNIGALDLRLLFVRLPPGFSLRNAPAQLIPPSESTTLQISMDAEFGGVSSGRLLIQTNTSDAGMFFLDLIGSTQEPPPTGGVDDLDFFRQWHHRNTGYQGGIAGYDARTFDAWSATLGQGVTVAVLDSGVQTEHPELRQRIVGEFLNNFDYNGSFFGAGASHGTAVAGLVAAEANYYGGRGAAPRARLFTTSLFNLAADVAASMYAAHDAGAAIHTNSWGYTDPTNLPDVVRDAVQDLARNGRDGKGVCFFFSAGNDSRPVVWRSTLASLPETITVAAATNIGTRASYSNVGPWVDIAAPSSGGTVGIFSTDVTGASGYNQQQSNITGDFVFTFSGTSAAAPTAAGTAALILSVNPDLYAEQVRRILHHTARRDVVVGANRPFHMLTRFSDSFGYGLIDAAAAVEAAAASLSDGLTWPAPARAPSVARAPTVNTISWTNPDPADPAGEFAGAMLVAYSNQILWRPEDGVSYDDLIGGTPAPGVVILARGAIDTVAHAEVTPLLKRTYAVFTYNAANRYSIPVAAYANPIEPHVVFFDNMEGEDPGWQAGPPDSPFPFADPRGVAGFIGEWERGGANNVSIDLEGFFSCAGSPCLPDQDWGDPIPFPPAIAGFTTPFSGAKTMATDLDGVYTPSSNHVITSRIIDLTNANFGSYSLSFRELLDTEGAPYDFASLRVVDADSGTVIRTLLRNHQELTYQWREQWFDLRNQRGRRIRLVFSLQSDNLNQFHGWHIDDVRIGASIHNPPSGNQPRRIILPGFEIPMELDAGTGGDLNDDDIIGIDDLVVLFERWGETRDLTWFSFDADLDGDGRIGLGDVVVMLSLVHAGREGAPEPESGGMK